MFAEKPARTLAASFAFTEAPGSGRYDADGRCVLVTRLRLTGRALDRGMYAPYPDRLPVVTPATAGYYGVIAEVRAVEEPDGSVRTTAWVQGGDNGGRRYVCRDTLGWAAWDAACERIFRWADRRFRVPRDGNIEVIS